VRVGVRGDGRSSACTRAIDNDHGGYVRTHGATVPEIGSALLPGPYRIPHYLAEVPLRAHEQDADGHLPRPGPLRGHLRPRAPHRHNRESFAPSTRDVRRRNLITPAEMPYDVGTGGLAVHTIYDTGDYPALLEPR